MKHFRYLLMLFLAMSVPFAYSGNEMGNGTDNFHEESGSAWYLGKNKSVHYCFVSSSKFGLSPSQIETEIAEAIATWTEYLKTRKLNDLITSEALHYSLDFKDLGQCSGTEDLKFLFGIESPDVTDAKKIYDNPTALALRTHFDKKNGWSKGIIWLSPPKTVVPELNFPNWTKQGVLQAILLHELGHAFGVGHVQNTIMDTSLSDQLLWDKIPDHLKRSIDGKRELLFCWHCPLNYGGVLGVGAGNDEDVRVFQRIVGRKPNGPIQTSLVGDSLWASPLLRVSDNGGSYQLRLAVTPQSQGPIFKNGIAIFKRVVEGHSTEQNNYGQVLFGALTDLQNQKLNVALEVNSSNDHLIGPIALIEVRDGIPHTIFRAVPKQ